MKIHQNFQTALAVVAILWLVYFINYFLPMDLRLYGLRPRQLDSLAGIVFTPFLHIDLRHLIANSGILFVLLTVSLSFSRKLTFRALWIIVLVGGGLVWLAGNGDAIHVGASGVIFGLIGFLMGLGLFRRDWKALINELIQYKNKFYPEDKRIVVICGMREGNVHVEWMDSPKPTLKA